MGIQNPTSSDRFRTYWTPTMEHYFIDLLLDQVHRSNRMGHTFNKQAWTDMITMFNAEFRSQYDKDVLKNQYSILWKQFNDIKNLIDQNGFNWDDTRQMVIADEYVWEAYIQDHPDAQYYKNRALLNFTDLCSIYAYTTADGRYSRSSHDIDFDDDIQGFNIGDGMISVAPASNEHPKPDWTPAMDQYFLKLMLDQVRKGNKTNTTFKKQAWMKMTALFNAKFNTHYGKRVLRQQYKRFWKYYSDLSSILDHNGFLWDETQEMVVAADSVWDNYIKAHPHAESYRRKMLPNYQELGVIFGNAITNGIYSHWHQDKDLEDDILQVFNAEGFEGRTPIVNDYARTSWTVPMDRYFIDLLLEQALKGNKVGCEFVTEAWIEMVRLFNTRFDCNFNIDVLKNRGKHLRRQYNDIKILLEYGGFSYDDTREMVIAEDYVWNSYIKEHPEARSYRNKTLPSYHKLCVIFGQESSSGRYLQGIDEEDMQHYAGSDCLRTDWNPSMDRYLIDLMLEQVLMGNGIGQTFNEQAWINILASFKERFGFQHDRDVLMGRHKSLMKLYCDMKNLLDQSGFLWDETQQMVTAYDDVWDAYIKEQPDVKSFRTGTKPNYNDLSIIYGKSTSDGGSNQSELDVELDGIGGFLINEGRGIRAYNNLNYLRSDWTPPMDRYVIDLMLEQVRKGSMVDNKFNKQSWSDMVSKFNATFGSQHNTDVLKGCFKNLKKLFDDIKVLLDHGGFVWDEMQQMITGDSDLWDAYIKDHPDARSYRGRSLPNYNDLFLIFGNATSSWMHFPPSHSTDVNDNILGVNGADDDPSPVGSDPLIVDWTKPMDRYFIDLMLEQLHKGNKIGHTFSEQAWACMITSFNKEFGLQYDRYILEDHYLSLMREYNSIRTLLNHKGFVWDEARQRVMADDYVWEAYIKEHPDVLKHRGKTMGSYNDLSIICGQGNSDGRLSHMGSEMDTMDDNALDLEMDEIYGILQSPPWEVEIPYPRKRQSESFSTSGCSRKVLKASKEGMEEALGVAAAHAGTMLSSHREEDNYSSIETIVDALQTIPDLDDELFLHACELLEDENKAETFVALDVSKRKQWLLRKLRH